MFPFPKSNRKYQSGENENIHFLRDCENWVKFGIVMYKWLIPVYFVSFF